MEHGKHIMKGMKKMPKEHESVMDRMRKMPMKMKKKHY